MAHLVQYINSLKGLCSANTHPFWIHLSTNHLFIILKVFNIKHSGVMYVLLKRKASKTSHWDNDKKACTTSKTCTSTAITQVFFLLASFLPSSNHQQQSFYLSLESSQNYMESIKAQSDLKMWLTPCKQREHMKIQLKVLFKMCGWQRSGE